MFRISRPTTQAQHLSFLRSYAKNAAKGGEVPQNTITPSTYGQPVHETHPQLLKNGEITPGIHRNEFQDRRRNLVAQVMAHVTQINKNIQRHLIVVPSATKQYMSDKIPYVFRQNSDFLYLTGCQEPDSCLVISANNSCSKHTSILFVRQKDDYSELWDGPRTGPEGAPRLFGVEQSLPIGELESYLHSYMKDNKSSSLWYDYNSPLQTDVHNVMLKYLQSIITKMWESPKLFLHKQRLIKSAAEVRLMQKTCEIASAAIAKTIATSETGINEHEIFAKVDYESRALGAEFLAYPPVVAGGNRANTIHYINNNQVVHNGEMVLMDAGCEFHGYSSDITRTWPINGRFTPEQKLLYEVVLYTQKELIQQCRNFPSLDSLFDSMCSLLGKGLQDIGVIPKIMSSQSLIKAAFEFCPHHVSHYLGMDVHDTPLITRNIPMRPGMVITIEPGVYINHKQSQVPSNFRGLGIRIEDDILITENGPIVLTKNCPKEIDDLELLSEP